MSQPFDRHAPGDVRVDPDRGPGGPVPLIPAPRPSDAYSASRPYDAYPACPPARPSEDSPADSPPRPRRGRVRAAMLVLVVVVLGGLGVSRIPPGAGRLPQAPADDAPAAAPVPLTAAQVDDLERRIEPGMVDIVTELPSADAVGAGSGIVLSPDGEVLTNNHVIKGATVIAVTDLGDGRSYQASVVGYDPVHDLAVLRMQHASGLRTAPLGDSDTLRTGDQVVAVGNAGGVGGRPAAAAGPVTDLDRSIATSDELTGGVEQLAGLIEAGADIRPGDSGGPLVNSSGQVVGVDVAASVDAATQSPDGTGFAIPIDDAMAVVARIRSGAAGDTVHIGDTAQLGVTVSTLTDRQPGSDADGSGPVGAFVAAVSSGSPAERAGLSPADVITAVGDTAVDSSGTLVQLLGADHPGDRVHVRWLDVAERTHEATVTLAAGPPN